MKMMMTKMTRMMTLMEGRLMIFAIASRKKSSSSLRSLLYRTFAPVD